MRLLNFVCSCSNSLCAQQCTNFEPLSEVIKHFCCSLEQQKLDLFSVACVCVTLLFFSLNKFGRRYLVYDQKENLCAFITDSDKKSLLATHMLGTGAEAELHIWEFELLYVLIAWFLEVQKRALAL